MQHCSHHEGNRYTFDFRTHRLLGGDHIGDYVRQRTVVANRTGEDKLNILLHTTVHDALFEYLFLDRLRYSTGAANCVNGAHMIFMPLISEGAALKIDTKRCSIESLFYVVSGQSVSGEQ